MHAVNACEVLYLQQRRTTAEDARRVVQSLMDGGVDIRGDFDLPFLQIVADYKTAPASAPIGDCFGLALAQREGLPFVASDHEDMDRVAARGAVVIDFIR
jgi:uncharacterized protein with PIN domain